MRKDIIQLYIEFNKIRRLEWIKSLRNGPTGIGYTFETLLNKKEDCQRQPDYQGIEIKTIRYLSKRIIHLFNATPDGNIKNPIKEITNKIGYPDKIYPKYKVFHATAYANVDSKIGYKIIRLYVNREKKRIDFIAKSIYGKDFNLNISWSFDMLKEALESKLKKLAIIKALTKKNNNSEFFYYKNIQFYELKSFDVFINLIESGIISVSFKICVIKDKNNLIKTHDKGTDFSIAEKNISLLFNIIST